MLRRGLLGAVKGTAEGYGAGRQQEVAAQAAVLQTDYMEQARLILAKELAGYQDKLVRDRTTDDRVYAAGEGRELAKGLLEDQLQLKQEYGKSEKEKPVIVPEGSAILVDGKWQVPSPKKEKTSSDDPDKIKTGDMIRAYSEVDKIIKNAGGENRLTPGDISRIQSLMKEVNVPVSVEKIKGGLFKGGLYSRDKQELRFGDNGLLPSPPPPATTTPPPPQPMASASAPPPAGQPPQPAAAPATAAPARAADPVQDLLDRAGVGQPKMMPSHSQAPAAPARTAPAQAPPPASTAAPAKPNPLPGGGLLRATVDGAADRYDKVRVERVSQLLPKIKAKIENREFLTRFDKQIYEEAKQLGLI